MRRVVITGAGCITAIGNSVEAFRSNLVAGVTGIREIENVPPGSLLFSKVARVIDFSPMDWLLQSQLQLAERSSQFAIASSRQAISASRLTDHYAGEDIAVIFGCSAGGRTAEEPETAKLYTQGSRVHPLTVPRAMASAGTSLVCMEHGITGPAYTVSTACASAAHAIGQAFHMVRSGMVKAAVTGGHEAPLTYAFLKSWDSLRAVSPTYCRPFAADRDGTTLGEGAAVFTLETMDAALNRCTPILAEVVGFGMSSDATHITQPNPAGSAAAMNRALSDAEISPRDVGYINAHGTGTEINDRMEAQAIHRVFGEAAGKLPITSTKGLHGHAMGATGALEFLATMLVLQNGRLTNAGGSINPDASLGLGFLLEGDQEITSSFALSNSFAFGGLNAVLAVRKYLA